MRKKTKAKTFDLLREEIYSNSAAGLENLPPTSSVIRGHILRGAFLVNKACTLLGNSNHEQEDYKKNIGIWVGRTVWGYASIQIFKILAINFHNDLQMF